MHIDLKLDFKSHIIQYLEIKIAKSILLYHAVIHSHLIFALSVWGSTFPTYLSKLQRLQSKAVRIIANCNRFQSVTSYFHELKIQKISDFNLNLAK